MIKEIDNLFRQIATSHLIINSFKTGDLFELQKTGSDFYPMLFLENDSDTISYNSNMTDKSYSITYYVFEIPKDSYEDYLELKHKIELINNDIVNQLYLISSDLFHSINNINSIFLKEYSNDKVVGIRTELTFNILNNINLCNQPI